MGNDISRNCGDGPAHELTSSTVKSLNKPHIFPEYPSDRTKADKLISIVATNALKFVNTDFRSKLGGHRKRKYDSRSDNIPSPIKNIYTPKRRSPRKVSSLSSPTSVVASAIDTASLSRALSNNAIDLFCSDGKHDNHPSIISSSIFYRVLLPNDIFQLEEDDNVVLVVDKNSYGFTKSIY